MNLTEIFELSTDAVEAPHLAGAALQGARARRLRRRVTVAAAVAVIAVVGSTAVLASQQGDGRPAPAPVQTPTPTASSSSSRVATPLPGASSAPPAEKLQGTQPRWDPRKVADLPTSPAGTVRGLPVVVAPPRSSAPLVGDPVAPAVLAVVTHDVAQILSIAGEWRSVPVGSQPGLQLSPAGTRLAITDGTDGPEDSVVIGDLTAGVIDEIPYPAGFPGADFATLGWVDEDTLLFAFGGAGRLVDVTSRAETPVPYPETSGWSVDSDGVVVEGPCCEGPREFIDWAGGSPRRVPWPMSGRLDYVHASGQFVAGTWGGWIVLADRTTLRARKVLPIRDPDAFFANGPLGVLAVQDDGTVLFRVTDDRSATIRVVAWEPGSGDISLVSTLPIVQVAFTEGLLRRTDP